MKAKHVKLARGYCYILDCGFFFGGGGGGWANYKRGEKLEKGHWIVFFTYLGQMNKTNLSFQSLCKNPCNWKGKGVFSSGKHLKLFQWVTKNILFVFDLNVAWVLDNSNWSSTNLQILLLLMPAALPSKIRLTNQAGFQQTLLSLLLGWYESNKHMWV